MSENRKMRVSFQKGMPGFLARMKEAVGYQEPELGDKFKASTDAVRKASKEEDYDVDKAQIVEEEGTKQPVAQPTPTAVAPNTTIAIPKNFKPSFKQMDKKQRNRAVVQHQKKQPDKTSGFKMSSQSQQQFQERLALAKDRLLHEKTKKIFKSNRNMLSFGDDQ